MTDYRQEYSENRRHEDTFADQPDPLLGHLSSAMAEIEALCEWHLEQASMHRDTVGRDGILFSEWHARSADALRRLSSAPVPDETRELVSWIDAQLADTTLRRDIGDRLHNIRTALEAYAREVARKDDEIAGFVTTTKLQHGIVVRLEAENAAFVGREGSNEPS